MFLKHVKHLVIYLCMILVCIVVQVPAQAKENLNLDKQLITSADQLEYQSEVEDTNKSMLTSQDTLKSKKKSILEDFLSKSKDGIELEDLRTDISKTILNKNGTKTLFVSPQIANNTLVAELEDKSFDYSNKKSSFDFKFGKTSNKPIKIQSEKYSLIYKPIDTRSVVSQVYGDTITYENAWQDTILRYSVKGQELKMYLQMTTKNAPKEFKFEIDSKNLSYRILESNVIVFYDQQTEKTIFTLPKMWVMGVDQRERNYDQIALDISTQKNKTVLTIRVDDTGLTYPLLVDPTTTVGNDIWGVRRISDLPVTINSNYIIKAYFDLELWNEVFYLDDQGNWEAVWEDTIWPGDVYMVHTSGSLDNRMQNSSHVTSLNTNISVTGDFVRSKIGTSKPITGVYFDAMIYGPPAQEHLYYQIDYDENRMSDSTPPSAPSNLRVTSRTSNSANLIWAPSSDDVYVDSYEIYNGSTFLGSTAYTAYNVTGLSSDITYTFTIKAKDSAGNLSTGTSAVVPQLISLTSAEYYSYRSEIKNFPISFDPDITNYNITLPQDISHYVLTLKFSLPNNSSLNNTDENWYITGNQLVWFPSINYGSLTKSASFSGNFGWGPKTYTFNFTRQSLYSDTQPHYLALYYVTNSGEEVPITAYYNYDVPDYFTFYLPENTSYVWSSADSYALQYYEENFYGNSYVLSVTAESGATKDFNFVFIKTGTGDEISPTINPILNPDAPTNGNVIVTTNVNESTDVKYAPGNQDVSYFATQGTYIYGEFTVTENGEYTIYARDNAGNESVKVIRVAFIDRTPPTIPNLTAGTMTTTSVILNWTTATDNVGIVGYEIYNGTTLMASTNTTSYKITGLVQDMNYSFTVRAKDAAGNLSAPSQSVKLLIDASTIYSYNVDGSLDFIKLTTGVIHYHYDLNGNLLSTTFEQ